MREAVAASVAGVDGVVQCLSQRCFVLGVQVLSGVFEAVAMVFLAWQGQCALAAFLGRAFKGKGLRAPTKHSLLVS